MTRDTLHGNAIDYSAKRLGICHQAAFDMRHKILLVLQELPETDDVCLGEVSEFNETFALDCYKGSKLDSIVKDCNGQKTEEFCFYHLKNMTQTGTFPV